MRLPVSKQAYDMGLHKTSMLVNSWTTYDVAMGIPAEAAEQLHALTYYYYDIGGFSQDLAARGKALNEDHMKKYGHPPDAYAVLGYTAVDVLLQAVQKAGSVDGKKVGKVLGSATFNTVKGPTTFRAGPSDAGQIPGVLCQRQSRQSAKKSKYDVFEVLGAYGGDKALPPVEESGLLIVKI